MTRSTRVQIAIGLACVAAGALLTFTVDLVKDALFDKSAHIYAQIKKTDFTYPQATVVAIDRIEKEIEILQIRYRDTLHSIRKNLAQAEEAISDSSDKSTQKKIYELIKVINTDIESGVGSTFFSFNTKSPLFKYFSASGRAELLPNRGWTVEIRNEGKTTAHNVTIGLPGNYFAFIGDKQDNEISFSNSYNFGSFQPSEARNLVLYPKTETSLYDASTKNVFVRHDVGGISLKLDLYTIEPFSASMYFLYVVLPFIVLIALIYAIGHYRNHSSQTRTTETDSELASDPRDSTT